MKLNFLKQFFRNLFRQKTISIINGLGIITAALSSLLIFEYVFYERSFDDYHENANNVYRIAYDRIQDGKLLWETANSYYPAGEWLDKNYDEVVNHTTLSRNYNITVLYEDLVNNKIFFNEEKTYYSKSSIFELFSIPIITGTIRCIDDINTVAISEKAADRYFGKTDPIGKLITVNGRDKYTVTAVFQNIPKNSHIKTDFFFSIQNINPERYSNDWGYDYFHTYIQLKNGLDAEQFKQKAIPEMIAQNYQSNLEATNSQDVFYFQPINKIHLHSNIEYETELPGNATIVNILFGFGIFLLIIAWINFVNLSTAKALDRSREIGIRKVNGANKMSLTLQFLTEAIIFNTICLFITLLLFSILNPVFRNIAGIEDFVFWHDTKFITIIIVIFILGITLASMLPAFIISSYKSILFLKGKIINTGKGMLIRKVLVTTQFVISIALLIGTFISNRQANFLMNRNMGVNYHESLVIRSPKFTEEAETAKNKMNLFKDKILQLAEISDCTLASDVPGQEINNWFWGFRKEKGVQDGKAYFRISVDDKFIDFYDIELLAGRKYYKGESPNERNILMNMLAVQRYGIETAEDAIGKIITNGGQEFKIIGVVDDFHYKSVKVEPVPTVVILDNNPQDFLTLKLASISDDRFKKLISELNANYAQIFPNQPFDYFTLDDKLSVDLKSDRTFARVFGLFSGLAIFIAVIGIIGLILIIINQNQRELGIRKALGAELQNIVQILSKQVSTPFIIAIIIALPLSYFGYKNWFLENYIYQINLNFWVFILPILIISGAILLLINTLAHRVLKMNLQKVLQQD